MTSSETQPRYVSLICFAAGSVHVYYRTLTLYTHVTSNEPNGLGYTIKACGVIGSLHVFI